MSCCRLAVLGGFRYLGLNEGLDITQITQGLRGTVVTGAFGTLTGAPRFRVVDQFRCQNHFYGPQVGVHCELPCGPCWFALGGKVGLGVADQPAG